MMTYVVTFDNRGNHEDYENGVVFVTNDWNKALSYQNKETKGDNKYLTRKNSIQCWKDGKLLRTYIYHDNKGEYRKTFDAREQKIKELEEIKKKYDELQKEIEELPSFDI